MIHKEPLIGVIVAVMTCMLRHCPKMRVLCVPYKPTCERSGDKHEFAYVCIRPVHVAIVIYHL